MDSETGNSYQNRGVDETGGVNFGSLDQDFVQIQDVGRRIKAFPLSFSFAGRQAQKLMR